MTDAPLRFCQNCKLVYRPDPRIHKDPEEFCPRCGFRLEEGDKLWKGKGYG
ncbi:MAG: hypothetical protein AB1491_00115 [Thermodesulfobacteriota bacterium]